MDGQKKFRAVHLFYFHYIKQTYLIQHTAMKQKRYFLNEADLPKQWYNIQADMVNKPMPLLNPATRQSLTPEDLYPLFAKELSRQELNQTDRWSP